MAEFLGVLIVVLISTFAILLAGALFFSAAGLLVGKALSRGDDDTWISEQSWRKIIALTLGMIIVLCIEITGAIHLGVFKDDASLHCGPGTTYHLRPHGEWTCELS